MRRWRAFIIGAAASLALVACGDAKEQQPAEETEQSGESTKVTAIDQESARQLVSERLDTNIYSVEADTDLETDGKDYYIFKVLEGDKPLSMGVAVDKISGELYAYNFEGVISPYSEFTLYDEKQDAQVEWNGIFQGDKGTLELAPADSGSFEFTFTKPGEGEEPVLTQMARAEGNQAVYEGEELKITFTYKEGSIEVTEEALQDKEAETTFAGVYTLVK